MSSSEETENNLDPVDQGFIHPVQFKVTFIYRKFINSYTDKFIILERDIYICLNIYIYISNSYLNSC